MEFHEVSRPGFSVKSWTMIRLDTRRSQGYRTKRNGLMIFDVRWSGYAVKFGFHGKSRTMIRRDT